MKRKESEEKENSSCAVLPSAKRRRVSGGGVLGEILSLYGRQPAEDFVLCRRLEDSSSTGCGIHGILPEELILRIFGWLDKGTLGRVGRVCKKWHRLSQDESLWKRLDLGSKTLSLSTLLSLSDRGILALRLAKAFVLPSPNLVFSEKDPLKLTYLDLSMCELSLESLKALLRRCGSLSKVSLEHVPLDDEACTLLATLNPSLRIVNLNMAKGFSFGGLQVLLSHCLDLEELNMGWTEPCSESIAALSSSAPPSLRRLNMAGCKEILTDKDLSYILSRLPRLTELDVSDAGSLSEESMEFVLTHCKKLEQLSVSRCYGISPNAYISLGVLNSLRYLDVFGVMKDTAIQELRLHLPGIGVNKHMFSTVARPTVGIRKTSIWNVRVRD